MIHRKPLILLTIALVGILCCLQAFQARADPGLPAMTLTVVGPGGLNGTKVVLNENDIGSLTSYTGFGGYVRGSGALSSLGFYTGVPISTFVAMVANPSISYSVNVTGADGYSIILSYSNLTGNLQTFDNVTGAPVQHNQTLTVMLAYYINGTALPGPYPSGVGPLELVIVGPEGLLTTGKLWVSWVVSLQVTGTALTQTVGGESYSMLVQPSKLQVITPWLIVASLMSVATVSLIYIKRRRK